MPMDGGWGGCTGVVDFQLSLLWHVLSELSKKRFYPCKEILFHFLNKWRFGQLSRLYNFP